MIPPGHALHQPKAFMKHPFQARAPTSIGDVASISAIINDALASAGLPTSTMQLPGTGSTIKQAMAAANCFIVPSAHRTQASVDASARRDESAANAGSFERHEFRNHAGVRAYKLFVPAGRSQGSCPLIVMLHGCTQSADDFAAGTQMNRLALDHGFIVVYPEQAAQANASKCWNWFQPQDQQRDCGEPSLIAGIVQEVAVRHDVDANRIFIAGLSAGAAMAIVMGETYPELFAGVGAHSGLPYGSAQDIPSALLAMKGGRGQGAQGMKTHATQAVQPMPLIVFHGDRDHTVQHSNAIKIVEHAQAAHSNLIGSTQIGESRGGRKYSRTVHTCSAGHSRIESWTLHGAGHAWAGGHSSGSYTDAKGPDASAEMLRFFFSLPKHTGKAS